jgi:general stress protein 26
MPIATTKHVFDAKRELTHIVQGFDDAMLVTKRPDGSLHPRPMMLVEREPDGKTLWFVTNNDSAKVEEIELDPNAAVVMQGGKRFATLVGRAEVRRDVQRMSEIWQKGWRAWFPLGRNDPTTCLIRFEAISGEYWDRSGLKGVRYVFEAVRAMWKHERLDDGTQDEQHGRVSL